MTNHVLKRGLDIPIAGAASGSVESLPLPRSVIIDPREFQGTTPRLIAREGDRVERGGGLFHAKSDRDLVYRAPVSGTVREVQRGHRRVITGIVVDVDAEQGEPKVLDAAQADKLPSLSRAEVVDLVRRSGLWWSLRQRPLDRVASPDDIPQSILVCGTETGPLQPGAEVLLSEGDLEPFNHGLMALGKLTDGKVYLSVPDGSTHPVLRGAKGVELHSFKGPHPSGDPAVQINHIAPPSGGGVVWYIHAWDVARLGKVLATGHYPGDKVYAAVGAGVKSPRFVRSVIGCPVQDLVGPTSEGALRWIRGSVLTGTTIDVSAGGGWYSSAIHVLPDEVPRRLFGWMMPAFGEFSVHRAFPQAWLKPKTGRDLRPGIYGGHRGLVPVGQYRKVVVTPDIEPEFLMKALSSGNIEDSLSLGLLDLSIEEAALCTYVCPSKIEFDQLLRKGLELYAQEIGS
ncbi:MAG: NADH:ubiquinone reductase (Na(+)-transporting) subunit A [Deltaproteobacteria bacterium]|nr:MAG: NADH:ubiquinone reductase (Na(+)-transporting) subunit A [Deltaproteobacteria bacterium]